MDENSLLASKGKLLSIGGASEYLGVSIDTLRRWEKKGKLITLRSPGGHRYFSKDNLDTVFGSKYERAEETKPRSVYQTDKNTPESSIDINPQTTSEIKADLVTEPEKKDIEVPKTDFIRIIQPSEDLFPSPAVNENIVKEENLTAKESSVTSILEPPTVNTPVDVPKIEPNPTKTKSFNFINFFSDHYAIVIALIIILLFLIFVLIYFLTTPEKMISPII